MNTRQTKTRKSPILGITLPRELVILIDKRAAQARQTRSRFIADALWQYAEERPVRLVDLLERLEAIERKLSDAGPRPRKPRG